MRILFKRKQKETLQFCPAPVLEKAGPLGNPARGFFHMYTFELTKEGIIGPEPEVLEAALAEEERLVLVLIDIGAYRSKNLDNMALEGMEKILCFFRDHHRDVILRVVYDHQGKGLEREPSCFEQVLRHLHQIGPFLTKQYGVFVYQGMLVGSWGEMHTSRFLGAENLIQMSEVLKTYCQENTWFAVRKPVQWRTICPDRTAGLQKPQVNMGLFDDAMLASSTNLGTFGVEEETDPLKPWEAQKERIFEEKLCRFVPHGGEAVFTEGYTDLLSGEQMLAFLRQCHVTYLNREYDGRIMELWDKIGILESIEENLGYRFVIREVQLKAVNRLEILIENTGFANIYQKTRLYLINGQQQFPLAEDMRTWDSGSTKRLICNKSLSEGEVYLAARRESDDAVIHFANEDDAEGRVLLGKIVKVEEKR